MKTFTRFLQSLVCALISILVFFSCAQAQTGTLTGTVRNCFTNQSISGATVSCASHVVLTNAARVYYMVGLPAGNYTATASFIGFTSATQPCTIVNGQIATLNFCLYPPAGILTGIITDCASGNPIVGAKVSWGTNYTYSTTGGYYSMNFYLPGTNAFQVAKSGYNLFIQNGVTVTPPNTTTENAQLSPGFAGPPTVNAVLNAGQTAADINWSQAMSDVELAYDDYGAEQCLLYSTAGSISAVKFTPCGYPSVLRKCMISVCGSNFASPLQVNVYNADGPGGMPGTVLEGPVTLTPSANGWTSYTFPSPLTITSGSFYIGMVQIGDQTNSPGLSVDTTTNQFRSYQKMGSGPWIIGGGNYMIHAVMDEPCGSVPPGNITYTVSRLLQGQENSPAAWVQVGNVTGSYTMTDNSWTSVPCGPYRWAVTPGFPCSGYTTPGFSNVIGKCWTAAVTFHGQKCCSTMGKDGLLIHAQNLELPDTVYSVTTDTTGTAVIQHMWKGHYTITASMFGCSTYVLTVVSIFGDMTLNINLNGGPAFPPTNLKVCDTTLLATWNKPVNPVTILDENWSSSSFITNGWTTSGGTNWMISAGIGNPAPSAMFYYNPQVTSYDQYLMSTTFPSTTAPVLKLSYDIQLNNYGTTTVNSMAVEVWDGASWHNLKTYDNSGGSFPWESETLNLSPYRTQPYKIRFHAYGGDSYDINNWNIDNIRISEVNDMSCLTGYLFTINNMLGPFVPDTFYQIPSNEVIYGHTYVACVKAIYSYNPGYSAPDCYSFIDYYLPPPNNFHADSIGCTGYLTWEKPILPTGGLPPVLLGYHIYRQGWVTPIATINTPNIFEYYDNTVNPGTWVYGINAVYNIYGNSKIVKDTAVIICGDQIPFYEGWTQNNFTFNGWTFDPSQGNWNTTSVLGNPLPAADFSWTGKGKQSLNYENSLVSTFIDGSEWNCSHLFFDADLKLVDRYMTSTEKMTLEIFYDQTWHTVGEFVNNGSFDWTTETFPIDAARGKGFKIRFRAHGDNTTNFLHWYIDNIRIYGNCLPPGGLQWTANAQQVNLSWTAPCSAISSYNVFRSDSAGNPPFVKVNATAVTGTSYTDVPPGWSTNDFYRYYITAVQMNNMTNSVLCEAASDTVIAAYPTGIQQIAKEQISIYPNPADNQVTIRSGIPLQRIEVLSDMGKVICSCNCKNEKTVTLNTAQYSQGICFLRITTTNGIFYRKIVICR